MALWKIGENVIERTNLISDTAILYGPHSKPIEVNRKIPVDSNRLWIKALKSALLSLNHHGMSDLLKW